MTARTLNLVLAGASGVLLALSFPTFGHPACAWIALAPLMLALSSRPTSIPGDASMRLSGASLRSAFVLGVITGAIYFGATLSWLPRVMIVYGNLEPWIGVLVNIALVATLALFTAAFAVTFRSLNRAFGPRALAVAPLVWVATELARTYVMSGFPWVLLGYSQTRVLPIAQFASLLGVYGVSGLLVSVSAAATWAGLALMGGQRPSGSAIRSYGPLMLTIGVVIAIAVWGSLRVRDGRLTTEGEPVTVGLVQGNVDQAEKWDAVRASAIFDDYLRLTREAIARGATFVIWPESSTPFFFEEDPGGAERIRAIAREARVSILLGSNQVVHNPQPDRYFNAAFMVRPDGSTGGVYRKMHLVPFGEYVPLKRLLFFAKHLVQAVSDFTPGTVPLVLPVGSHLVSVAICYEIVYPDLVRQYARRGSELLTTITNDAWFGDTSAPYQHFEQASMRAIEEGRYLVRAANTGISGIVDPYGRVLQQSHLYEPAVLVGEARYLQVATLYSRIGDLFAYLSAAVSVALLLQSRPWRSSTI